MIDTDMDIYIYINDFESNEQNVIINSSESTNVMKLMLE